MNFGRMFIFPFLVQKKNAKRKQWKTIAILNYFKLREHTKRGLSGTSATAWALSLVRVLAIISFSRRLSKFSVAGLLIGFGGVCVIFFTII
jgi:hypothetical protein